MVTEYDLLNCAGWKIFNSMAPLSDIHNVFLQNWLELEKLLHEIHDNVQVSRDIKLKVFMHLQQKIFNYLASSSALTDTARRIMKHYKGTTFFKEYDKKTSELFKNNKLSHFIRKLRNYQTHYQLTFPYPVHSLDDYIHWDVVLISADLLEHEEEWNLEAKQFINECGETINLNKIFKQYNDLINSFYMWLYKTFREYYKKDLEERDCLISEFKTQNPSHPLSQMLLSHAECENLAAELQREP